VLTVSVRRTYSYLNPGVFQRVLKMFFLWFLTLFAAAASAQFQFFDQFFGGQQQQGGQQEKQNVASDSTWFQQNWQQGKDLALKYLCHA